jgi:hypothetical protein
MLASTKPTKKATNIAKVILPWIFMARACV